MLHGQDQTDPIVTFFFPCDLDGLYHLLDAEITPEFQDHAVVILEDTTEVGKKTTLME